MSNLMRTPVRVRTEKEPTEDTEPMIAHKISLVQEAIQVSRYTVLISGDDLNNTNEIPAYNRRQKPKTIRFPTFSHMAIAQLFHLGLLKHIITQSTNGLHIMSGIPQENVTELFGNRNVEVCTTCKTEEIRQYRVRNNKELHHHNSGRFCSKCETELKDNIVNLHENVNEIVYATALEHLKRAELLIIIGTNMRSNPLHDMVQQRATRVLVVNKRPTAKDSIADLKIFTDPLTMLLELTCAMQIHVAPYLLKQKLIIGTETIATAKLKMTCKLVIRGVPELHAAIEKVDCTTFDNGVVLSEKSIVRKNLTEFAFRQIEKETTQVMLKIYLNVPAVNGVTVCSVVYMLDQVESGRQTRKPGKRYREFMLEYNAEEKTCTSHQIEVADNSGVQISK